MRNKPKKMIEQMVNMFLEQHPHLVDELAVEVTECTKAIKNRALGYDMPLEYFADKHCPKSSRVQSLIDIRCFTLRDLAAKRVRNKPNSSQDVIHGEQDGDGVSLIAFFGQKSLDKIREGLITYFDEEQVKKDFPDLFTAD